MRCALALAFAGSLAAQEPQFGVQSRLVLVPATVTDAKGRSLEGLDASDFVLLDNGRPRKVVVDSFATGVAPIALVIAVQASGISGPVLAKVQKIGAMIQPLITGERGCAALVSFADRVNWLEGCTSNADALVRAFGQLRPGEEKSGRMLDAVHEAVERLRRRTDMRRVLLLISESRDRGSETGLETALVAAEAAGVTVYAATYSAITTAFITRPSDRHPNDGAKGPELPRREPESPPGRERVPIPPPSSRVDIPGAIGELVRLGRTNTTQALASRTGGTTFPFTRQKGLENAIQKLAEELHTQYVLSFAPDSAEPGYHRLEVRVTREGRWRVRARQGYWSGGGGEAR
jgi:VWFA-related protein